MHAWRRLDFMANKWHVPAGEYFDDVRPFVAKHRYFPYLESIALPPQEGGPAPGRTRRPFGPGRRRAHRTSA